MVSSFRADAFILTLNWFVARRGCRTTIYSDNTVNFQGADNLFRDVCLFFEDQKNLNNMHHLWIAHQIKWCFILQVSSHWRGQCEAGIKSTMFHLRWILGKFQFRAIVF